MSKNFARTRTIALHFRLSSGSISQLKVIIMKAILALEDGTIFEGISFGTTGTVTGAAYFNTSAVGYQEILSDPAHYGQIMALTYTMAGNYGVCEADNESDKPQVSGLVVRELSRVHSSWRAEESLENWLKRHNVLGIEGVDTRKLTTLLRDKGSQRACITTELTAAEAVERARAAAPLTGMNAVSAVTTAANYHWEGESRKWKLPNKSMGDLTNYEALCPVTHKVVAWDLGVTRSALVSLRQHGLDVTVVRAGATAEEILALQPEGIYISNGPGDPAVLTDLHQEVSKVIGKVPVLGVGLGCAVLAHAMGGQSERLPFGHNGGNHPVKELSSDCAAVVTVCNTFTVKADSLPEQVEVTHLNLNDNTVAGISVKGASARGIMFHQDSVVNPDRTTDQVTEFVRAIENV